MESVRISSYAKINYSIDVGDKNEDGLHEVDMVMQGISLCDFVTTRVIYDGRGDTELSSNRPFLPTGQDNLAVRAADLMREIADLPNDSLSIHLEKHIPVGAGMAGGSGNAAAVLHALNLIYDLGMGLGDLLQIGAELGSDVPFCLAAQTRRNHAIPQEMRSDHFSSSCFRARGTGTTLEPLNPIGHALVIAKPARLSISTKEAYKEIDKIKISKRPDNDILASALNAGNLESAYLEMINVFEDYSLKAEPRIKDLKETMERICTGAKKILMTGTGPAVFALMKNRKAAKEASDRLRREGAVSYWAYTIK
jgi:4-diphosphocytidyl-2-C-methyl-D-erythritol kinase